MPETSDQIVYPYNIFGPSNISCLLVPPYASDNPVLNFNVDNSSKWYRGRRGASAAAQDKIDTRRQL